MTLNTENIIIKFRSQDEAFIREVYMTGKNKFIRYLQKEFQLDSETCLDIYHDSFCQLHKNVMSKKIVEVTSSFDTLLIGFGRNFARNLQRKKREDLPDVLPEIGHGHTPYQYLIEKDRQLQVKGILSLIGKKCKSILVYFFYYEKSMKEIADLMNYANANVAKKTKYACLKKLKQKVEGIE